MAKYIEEKELREWVENWFEKNRYYHPYSKSNDIPITELYDILEQMPTADVVEVVRCKDCQHSSQKVHICEITNYLYGENYFCTWGERREE